MKEREFDMLENADDKTVELLSEVPVLSKEEKERMLAMSKKKLDMMNRENNIVKNSDEEQVSGVERYNRPKWHRFATMAACLVLVGGLAGTVFVLNKNDKKSDKDSTPMTKVTTTAAAGTGTTSAEATTAPAETTTASGIGEGEEEVPYYTQEQLIAIAKSGMENYDMFESMAYGYGVKVDETDKIKFGVPDENGEQRDYYRVTDERFQSMDDVNEFIAGYCTGRLYEAYKNPNFFTEKDGKLYYRYSGDERTSIMNYQGEPDISGYDGNKFTAVVPINWAGYTRGLKLDFENINKKWYIEQFDILDTPVLEENLPDEDTARDLLSKLSKLEGLSASLGVYTDADTYKEVTTDTGVVYRYYKVLDDPYATDFKNDLGDLQSWFEGVCTGEIHEQYKHICYTDEENPYATFMEFDGELYQLFGARGTTFNYCAEPTIENVTLDSFDIKVQCYEPVGYETLTVHAVKDRCWKLESYTYDDDNASQPTEEQLKEINYYVYGRNALDAINELENIASGGVVVDYDDVQIVRASGASVEYYKVRKNGSYPTMNDFNFRIDAFATGSFKESIEQRMNEGGAPMYTEIDGDLYCREDGTYTNYVFKGAIEITDQTDDSFTVSTGVQTEVSTGVQADAGIKKLTAHIIINSETGGWQISDYSIEE